MATLTRGGESFSYLDHGSPEGRPDAPTIVFGHGLLFSGWMFSAQVERLRSQYRVVTVDWRGQGASPAPSTKAYDMDTLYEDAVALVQHLEAGPVHWVGLSMGGFVGMRLAARRPDLVRTLTLLDTSADPEPLRNKIEDSVLALVYRLVGIGPVRGSVLKVMMGPAYLGSEASGAVIDEWIGQLQGADRRALSGAIMGVVKRQGVAEELSRILAPTLVATGDHDKPTPVARGQRIAAGVKDASFVLIPDSGHSSSIEQADFVSDLIGDFIATR